MYDNFGQFSYLAQLLFGMLALGQVHPSENDLFHLAPGQSLEDTIDTNTNNSRIQNVCPSEPAEEGGGFGWSHECQNLLPFGFCHLGNLRCSVYLKEC